MTAQRRTPFAKAAASVALAVASVTLVGGLLGSGQAYADGTGTTPTTSPSPTSTVQPGNGWESAGQSAMGSAADATATPAPASASPNGNGWE
ncbi:hypothetical protein [Streptomyces sp. TLI_171]|uniref:hypothetical protein n=1 Tax=Streptomyces sp. TLI_171 TaxID=1938859 RepID=UPI000C188BCE|nr:hypothetical protein [Streptomyces sp. TLI_171]RKE20795.1 hypothetical protein BX266_4168 [Streptomyces sp. TLI_171]